MENQKNKAILRIPTTEQYAYVEVQVEGTPSEIADLYREYTDAMTGGEGLNVQAWAKVRDHYALTGQIAVEDHEICNKLQRYILGQFKKALKKVNQE